MNFPITLTRPLVCLDIESAVPKPEPDPAVDKIVTLSCLKLAPDGTETSLNLFFNPGFKMSDRNIEIHGITNEQAAQWIPFNATAARDIGTFIAGCDICGFNSNAYDVPLLWEECWRFGVELDFRKACLIDACMIFRKKESRDLKAAVKFYLNREHDGAHNAQADVAATIQVLAAQIAHYEDLGKMDMAGLAKFSLYDEDQPRVDLAGKIVLKGGVPVYNFGKVKGTPVTEDPGYGQWMIKSDFPENTKRVVRSILANQRKAP